MIVVETAGETSEQADILELVHDTWLKAGIKLYTKPLQRETFRNRIFAGETLMSVWGGLENGTPGPASSPAELAPTSQQQLQWPKWGQHHQNRGRTGEACDGPYAAELLTLYGEWIEALAPGRRAAIWRRMLDIHADQVYSIGIVAAIPQPVVVNARLRNVPERGIYNWSRARTLASTAWIPSGSRRTGQRRRKAGGPGRRRRAGRRTPERGPDGSGSPEPVMRTWHTASS